MFVLGKKRLSVLFKIALQCIFIGGLMIFITLPFCLKWYLEFSQDFTTAYFYKTLLILYSSGILALVIVYQAIKLLKNVNKNNPFIMDNIKILNKIGVCSLLIAAIYIIAIFVIHSVFTIILFMTFTILGFMSIVLSGIFQKAIEYKEENDLTI